MTTTTMAPLAVPCGCSDTGRGCGCSGGCFNTVGLERTRFYPRQLIGPDELTQDQIWIRDKSRRHNRLLHGWGVVCGCEVRQACDKAGNAIPWTVEVFPGFVLGPYGDDIVVDTPTTFDLRGMTMADGCNDPVDPWCADVKIERKPRQTFYLAIEYDERLTRPVASLGGCGCGGGCDDRACEYSRIRESFNLTVLDRLPASYLLDEQNSQSLVNSIAGALRCSPAWQEGVRPCPPCPSDPWVVLADVVADADGTLTIDEVTHRRYTASFGAYWFSCAPQQRVIPPTRVDWTPQLRAELARTVSTSVVEQAATAPGGPVEAIANADAITLKGVGAKGPLAPFLAGRTLSDVAALDRQSFVTEAQAAGVDVKRAGGVWDSATGVMKIIGMQ